MTHESADALLARLKQSRFDNSRDAVLTELCAVDLLIIDDFALEPMGREESRDVYQLFVERNARTSTLVTSNRDTNEWLAMFDDMLLAQSAVDRFANNAYDLVIGGESYRPRLKPNIETSGPPPQTPIQNNTPTQGSDRSQKQPDREPLGAAAPFGRLDPHHHLVHSWCRSFELSTWPHDPGDEVARSGWSVTSGITRIA